MGLWEWRRNQDVMSYRWEKVESMVYEFDKPDLMYYKIVVRCTFLRAYIPRTRLV